MLIHVKEETLRVVFQPSFSRLVGQKFEVTGSNIPQNMIAGGSHVDMFCTLNALKLNKLYRYFLLILS